MAREIEKIKKRYRKKKTNFKNPEYLLLIILKNLFNIFFIFVSSI